MGETRCGCARAGFAAVLVALMCVLASAPMAYAAETTVEAAGMEVQAVSGAKVQTQADYDVSWYEGKTSPYTIKSLNQLKGLAYLVNSGTESFEGKTVQLDEGAQIIFLDAGDAIDPIGTEEHPFQGTFDGRRGSAAGGGIVAMANETRIHNLMVNVGDRLSYIGLFGYAGDKAVIKNLTITGGRDNPLKVVNEADGKSVSYVGAIAGYLGGCIENCYSSVEVSVTNNGAVPEKEGKTSDERCTLRYVGGLVGTLMGDMRNCVHADAQLSIASDANVNDNVPYIAAYIGGLVGMQGSEDDAANVTELEGCRNTGQLVFDVNGSGGVDRFGAQTFSMSAMVGGIAGFTMGNVADCANTGEIQTGIIKNGIVQSGWGANNVGGIVGSLRGPTIAKPASASGVVGSNETDPGYTVWTKSKGTEEPATLTIERCSNTAPVTGLGDVAGIAGSTGAFTQVIGCSNTAQIEGTRWNKPCPAGIVGTSNGDIAYCYNQGRCFSTTGGGYYASGITALLTTYNTSSTADNLRLADPQIYACYVTGSVGGTETGYRTAVISGENDGFIHDNCFLPDLTVDKAVDEDGFSDGQNHSRLVAKGENRGSLKNNHEISADEMRSSKAVSYLNHSRAMKGDWSMYYVPIPGSFPKLSWQVSDSELAKTSLSSIATGVSSVQSPAYSASFAPVPIVTLKTSDGRMLYQDADYKLVVSDDSREIGPTYQAKVVGINGYEGELSQAVNYTVDKADIGSCTVSAASQVFNWERQKPKNVTVRDDAGNVVDPSEYTYDVPWNQDGSTKAVKDSNGQKKYYDYINSHGESYRYDVTVTAKETSAHYKGSTTQAAFRIKWASMFMSSEPSKDPNVEESAKFGNVVFSGQEWDIVKALKTKGYVKIKYTGDVIKPTFKTVTYLGKAMRDGTGKPYYNEPLSYDYKYIYGNPNPEPGKEQSIDPINVTGSKEADLACMTIRFTQGGNFDNYTNVFFQIVPASIASDVKVSGIPASYTYDGKAKTPKPKLTYRGMTLKQGIDYTLSYAKNKAAGTASVTVKGKGNYAGTKTVTFSIKKAKQPMTVKAYGKAVKYSKLKKKAQAIAPFKVKKAQGKVTYKNVSTNKVAKKFKVSAKGKVTVPKKTKKGTYKLKVRVTAKGNANYAGASKTVTATIKVK